MKAWKLATATLFVVAITIPTVLGAIPFYLYTPVGTVSTAVPEAEARARNTTNNRLRNLTIPTGRVNFTARFNPTTHTYRVYVPEDVTRIRFQPTRDNGGQNIRHRHEARRANGTWAAENWTRWRSGSAANNRITVNINPGQERRLRIAVRDRAGNIRTYVINIQRASSNTWASGITASAGTLNRNFARNVTNYTLNLPANRSSVQVRLNSEHRNAFIRARVGTSGHWPSGARSSRAITVNVPEGASRTVQFNVRGAFSFQAPSPTRDRVYTVTINRARAAASTNPGTNTPNIPNPSNTPIFTLTGSGWGHGIGMSQNGAMQMAREGRNFSQILNHYFTGITIAERTPRSNMRVNLDANRANRATWTIGPRTGQSGSSMIINDRGTNRTVTGNNGPVTFSVSGGNIRMTPRTGTAVTLGSTIRITSNGTGDNQLLTVMDQSGPPLPSASHRFVRYRGTLELTVVSGRLRLVNELPMQQYLFGVVPREIPSNAGVRAAVEAQAIAARSYAHNNTGNVTGVSSTVSFQVYGGHSRFASETAWRNNNSITTLENSVANAAVTATGNRVILHGGNVVRAYYSACNGNHTANSEDVWSARLGHLRGVPDPFCGRSGHAGHNWTLTITGMDLARRLRDRGAAVPAGAGTSVYVRSFNSTRATGGWVRSVQINWSNGTSTTIGNADNVRIRMGLSSANFTATRVVPTGRALIAPMDASIEATGSDLYETPEPGLNEIIEELIEGDYSPLFINQEMRNHDCGESATDCSAD